MRSFLASAQATVGDAHVLTDADDTAAYAVDWTGRWVGTTPAVVRPGTTGEVAELVAAARAHRVALVPQGGNTGLVGGSVPHAGEVVVSLRRLDDLGPVDRLAGQVTAGAGVVLSALQDHAAAAGLAFGVDLAARGSATVGGMVATNAGGVLVMRHGAMRAQVVGVEAVLGDGQVVSRLSGLVKDNTGYDLAQLLCGSEGTLGIVTRARLGLVPVPGELVVALLAMPSIEAAVELSAGLRQRLPGLRALELTVGAGLRLVAERLGVPPPVEAGAPAHLLVEAEVAEPGGDSAERLATAVQADARCAPVDAAVAVDQRDRERLWRFREEATDTIGAVAAQAGSRLSKLDVTLPTAGLARFCEDVTATVARRWPGSTTLLFGHVGDGNVHVNVVPPAGSGAEASHEIDDAVLARVVGRGGSISAEHGIGVAKRSWLARDRSAAEVAAMRAVKRALDPDGILNPNVLL